MQPVLVLRQRPLKGQRKSAIATKRESNKAAQEAAENALMFLNSQFRVGAALLTKNVCIFQGCTLRMPTRIGPIVQKEQPFLRRYLKGRDLNVSAVYGDTKDSFIHRVVLVAKMVEFFKI